MSNEQKKPKTIGDVVVNKVLGVNAKVETTKALECGAVLFSINGGESFAAVTSDNQTATIANASAVFGGTLRQRRGHRGRRRAGAWRGNAGRRRRGAKNRTIQTKNYSEIRR